MGLDASSYRRGCRNHCIRALEEEVKIKDSVQSPAVVALLLTSMVAGNSFIVKSVASGDWAMVWMTAGLFGIFYLILSYIKHDAAKHEK